MHTLIRLLLLGCLTGTASTCASETLEEILSCNAEALGGEAAFQAIDNLRIELDIREPTFEVKGTYVASRNGRMRIDIFAGDQRVFAEGLNDEGAWQWNLTDGVTPSNAAGAAALRNGIESPGRFWTLGQLRERGLGIESVESGPLAREDEWQLRLTPADGPARDYFISRATCLPTRDVSRRAFHPDVDPTEASIETAFSEPERIGGVQRLRHSESHNLDSGEWLGTTKVRAVEHNMELAGDFFEPR